MVVARHTPVNSPPACRSDPSSQIDALPPGATWNGDGACYTVPSGILITQPVTLAHATFRDSSVAPVTKGAFHAVIQVQATSHVNLDDLTIIGGEIGTTFHPRLVGQAGIRLMNVSDVTIHDITVAGVFGDGLELWGSFPRDRLPDTRITVDHLDVEGAGRDGISPGNVYDATFDDVTVGPTGQASIDFESDLKGVGAGDLELVHCRWSGFVVGEALTGPISVVDSSLTNQILVRFRHPQPYAITFTNDSIALTPKDVPGIEVNRGSLVFDSTRFSRLPGRRPARSPMWSATNGSDLMFRHSTLAPPLGVADPTSTVTIVGASAAASLPAVTPEAPFPILLAVVGIVVAAAAILSTRRRRRGRNPG